MSKVSLRTIVITSLLIISFFVVWRRHSGGLVPFVREDLLGLNPPIPCHTNPDNPKNYIPDYYVPDYMEKDIESC